MVSADAIRDRVVLGTMPFRSLRPHATETILAAFFEAGGAWLDTASLYGYGEVERAIGRFLARERAPAKVATKIGYFADPSAHRSSLAVRQAIDAAIDRLGAVPAVISLHEADWALWWHDRAVAADIVAPGGADASAPAWQALLEAAAQLRFEAGMTGNNAGALLTASSAAGCRHILVAKQHDLLWRSAEQLLDWTAANGVRAWSGAPFHQGSLFRLAELRESAEWRDDREGILASRELEAALARHGAAVVDVAVPFVLADDRVDAVVVGVRSTDELQTALRACATPIDPALLRELRGIGVTRPPMPGVISGPVHG